MQEKTAILAATTPQDNSTYHSFLISRKDPDRPEQPLFNVVNLMEICKKCRNESDKPWKCTHKAYNTSSNKGRSKIKETLTLYRDNQKHVAMRELFGQAASGTGGLLPAEYIEQFKNSISALETPPRCIYLGIDPSGGGLGELGVVAMVEDISARGMRFVIIAACSVNLHKRRASIHERNAIIGIIRRMRDHMELRCPIICIPEAAPGMSASKIAADIEEANIPGIVVMSERSGYLEGVTKDDKVTFEYYSELEKALRSGCLAYWDGLVTTMKDNGKPRKASKEKSRMAEMMANLRMIPINPNLEHGDMRYKITAKVGQAPDDLLVALMMCLYWRGVFWRDQTGKYREWKDVILAKTNIRFPL